MSEQYGCYVSIRTAEGALLSSFRPTWAEVKDDLDLALGKDSADAILASLRGDKAESNVVALPVPTMTAQQVEQVLNEPVAEVEQEEPVFQKCEKCGVLKDEWHPPGITKRGPNQGKKYNGFYGCPNFRNH